ncbi:MAG: DUF1385 domain-containing protein [Clostridia bacterium]|nr:DUF1385 domain-containing protein [Clostridia bacterium]
MKLSGIGGQAVLEGVMMRNKDKYAIAVRKPDNEIDVVTRQCKSNENRSKICNVPIIRGVVSFVDSLVLGMSSLTYSSSFYEDPKEQEPTKADNVAKAIFREKLDSVIMTITILFSVVLAIALFMVAPYYISRLLAKFIVSQWVLNLIEGLVRVLIFIIYILLISFMSDIKRTFMYHGAEHKCINCIEHGMALTVDNIRASSKEHKRCGTSFIFLVMFISVIFFIFIRMPNPFLQIVVRILLVPVIAGVSYEVIRWAGSSDSKAVMIVSKPGLWLQKLTTREPDDSMIEVGIKAVEAVFDWKAFLDEYYEGVPDDQIPPEAFYYEDEDGTAYSEAEINGTAYDDDQEAEELDAEGYLEDEVMDEAGDVFEDESDEYDGEPQDYESDEYEDESDDGIELLDDEYDPDDAEAGSDDLDTADDAEPDDTDKKEVVSEDDTSEDTAEASDDDKQDSDGIEFVDDEEEEEEIGIEMPIFKQRHTEVGRDER